MTSPPPRRSKSKSGGVARSGPIKGIRLSVTLFGAGGTLTERLFEEGLAAKREGDDVTVAITAATPEEALAQLRLLNALLVQKR